MLELNVNNPDINHPCLPGLPLGWTIPHPGAVSPAQVDAMFPINEAGNQLCLASNCGIDLQQCQAVKREKCISLFSGVGGLELGMRQWRRLELILSQQNQC